MAYKTKSAAGNRFDDEIFEHTMRDFPEFADAPHSGLVKLDEDWIKSKEGKERWRTFINAYVYPVIPGSSCLLLWLRHAQIRE